MTKRSAGLGHAGFTLVELMIVIAIIAIIAAIAVPNMLAARMAANETATISTLRTITTAEAQFQRAGYADENNDSIGEYGTLGELGASVIVRGTTRYAVADMSASLAVVGPTGEVSRNGYNFRIYLPAAAGVGIQELPGGGMTAGVLDPTISSVNWCIYSYPEHYAGSGHRTFFANERCEITTTNDPRYQITGCTAVEAGAALRVGDITHITGSVAIGTRGADGNLWKPVQ